MNKDQLRTELNSYLYMYLAKPDLRMKPIISSIQYLVSNDHQITENQFSSIIKFLQRETKLRDLSINQIHNHFSPLIKGHIPISTTSSLDKFLIGDQKPCPIS